MEKMQNPSANSEWSAPQRPVVPKLTTMIDALENGVGEVVILSGVEESALLLELFTDSGVGTLIAQDDA